MSFAYLAELLQQWSGLSELRTRFFPKHRASTPTGTYNEYVYVVLNVDNH